MRRQAAVLDAGGRVLQETRHFHEDTGTTSPGRSKEEATDYRYFPEPDLVPVAPDAEWVEKDRKSTRLNSSHANISYAVFCLKKKKQKYTPKRPQTSFTSFHIHHEEDTVVYNVRRTLDYTDAVFPERTAQRYPSDAHLYVEAL